MLLNLQFNKMSTLVISLFVLLLSTLLSVFTSSWVVIWVLLELNTLAYCSLSFKGSSKESNMMYFVIQAITSSILVLGSLLVSVSTMLLALMVKLAVAPFHYWFIAVVKKGSWMNNKVLLTWQKLLPSYLLMFTVKVVFIFYVVLSSVVGSVFLVNKKSLKEIMALSSVFNLGWMVLAISLSLKVLLYFSFVYWISLNAFINCLISCNSKTAVFIKTINLGGVPPLMLFSVKWMVLLMLLKINLFVLCLFILVLSSINIYIYLRLSSVFLMVNSSNGATKPQKSSEVPFFLMNLLLLGLLC